MLTFEKVLEVFQAYLDDDSLYEVVQTSHGYTGTTPACFCLGMWELASPFSPVVLPTPCLTGMCRC